MDSSFVNLTRSRFYSPYCFIREIADERFHNQLTKPNGRDYDTVDDHFIFADNNNDTHIFYRYLAWDSDFFGRPVVKLEYIQFPLSASFTSLAVSIASFLETVKALYPSVYIFIDLPAEDILVAQALNSNGFKLIETRLHYFKSLPFAVHNDVQPVRVAGLTDAPIVGTVAATAVNEYDRYHADVSINRDVANKYLETYAVAAVNGFCTEVLIPEQDALDSFMALDHKTVEELGFKYSRIVLTAVGPKNKGWHYNYMKHTQNRASQRQSDYLLMTTQATNKAVINNAEKLQMKLGHTTHILSVYTNPL